MAKGQRTKAGHIIQMIYHGANPNLFNPNGKRVVAHNAEDYDFIDGIEFDKLGRKGAKALIANVPLEEMWTGKISGPLHYNLMDDQIFPFWIAKGVETPVTVDGVNCIDTEYLRPQLDRADRAFFAIEEGKAGGGADLGCYGMFTSFKWTSKRGNKGKSRMEFGFVTQAAVRRNSLTGGAMQNHKIRIAASNVNGPIGLSLVVPGLAAKAISLAIGDTTQQIKDKFSAQGVTVVPTGAISTSAGKSQTVSGQGNALSVGGVNVDLVTPETVATLVGRIKTANPSRNTLTGTGTITKASAVTNLATGGTPSSSTGQTSGEGNAASAFDGNLGTFWQIGAFGDFANRWIQYDFGTAKPVGSLEIYANTSQEAQQRFPKDFVVMGSNTGAFAGEEVVLLNKTGASPSASAAWNAFAFTNAGTYRYVRLKINSVTIDSNWLYILELKINSIGAPASVNFTLADAQNAGGQVDLPVVGAGYVFTSSPPNGSDGIIDVEITDPANTMLTVSKASGGTGYILTTTQYGGDGSILQAMKADDPIMPGHLFLYSADTPAGLEDEANLVGQIGEWEIDDPKICMPVSHHVPIKDPERPNLPATYNAHAEEESQEDGIKLSVTMDADDDGQVIATMQGLLRASGSRLVSLPRYWRIAAIHPGSPQRVYLDFYGSVGAAVPVKWGGSVEQYTFVYDLLENKTAPWNFKAKTRRLA